MKGLSLSVQKKVYDSLKINFFFRSLLNRIFFSSISVFGFFLLKLDFHFTFVLLIVKLLPWYSSDLANRMMLFEQQNVLKTFQSAKVLFKKKKVEFFKRHFQT